MAGPTDQYPRGKLGPTDRGELRLAMYVKDGTLILDFGTDLSWIGLDKQSALQLIEKISGYIGALK